MKIPITVENVRGKRSKPGLRPQHLAGIKLVTAICNGKLKGAEVGSTLVNFEPGCINSGDFKVDIQTAGSVSLLIQVALPCILYGPQKSTLSMKGGTNVEMAPPIEFFAELFIPTVKRFGVELGCDIIRRGFFPKGGGEVNVTVNPVNSLLPVQMVDFGEVTLVRGMAYVAGVLPKKVANIMAKEATSIIRKSLSSVPIKIDSHQIARDQAAGTGCGIMIIAETSTGCLLSGSQIGKKGIPAEQVGTAAAEELLKSIRNEACIDEHLQDQLIILMALADGKSAIQTGPLTLHTQTAIHIAEMLTKAKFTTKAIKEREDEQGTYLIECIGSGHAR
ncbi:RNA 3'-terminal phosphate cyclase-like isoform X2 [Rhopilema esculentum]